MSTMKPTIFDGIPKLREPALPSTGKPTRIRLGNFPFVTIPIKYCSRAAVGAAISEGRIE